MNHYHELKLKNNPLKWACEEFQRDRGYWLDRAINGKGLIKEIARFVVQNGKQQQEREYAVFLGIEAPAQCVKCKKEVMKVK